MKETTRPSNEPQPSTPSRGVTLRSVGVGLLLLFLSLLWLERAGLITLTVQIDESVPPIPAVAAVMLLGLLNPLLFRLGRRVGFSQSEIIVIFTLVGVGIFMSAVGVVRMFFPCITAPFYFATPENNFDAVNKFIPRWFGPRETELLRGFYEGAERIPWGAWLPTVLRWTFFFTVLFFTFTCIGTLFRRQWSDRERLTFPVAQLVLDIAEPAQDHRWVSDFFRNPLTWIGFGLSLFYNLLNILQAINPSIPAPGKHFDLGMLFTERPLSALRPFQIWYRPELIGLGYLMSMEVLLSGWVFYLLFKLEMLIAAVMGFEIAGFPFPQEQATGAYIALFFALLYFARQPLGQILKTALGLRVKGLGLDQPSPLDDSNEPLPYRLAAWGVLFGFVFIVGWCIVAGMAWWTAILYIGLILSFATVYARIRAETGAPYVWLFPYYQAKKMPVYALGSQFFIDHGGVANLTMLSTMMFLSRGFFTSVSATQMESFKLADAVGMSRRWMTGVLLFACVVGFIGAFGIHLHAYYTYGANVLEGGTTSGGYRTQLAVNEFTELTKFVKTPQAPDYQRVTAMGAGFILTIALTLARVVLLRFPLHPLGFAMVGCYPESIFGPFLIVWIVKTVILKLGGMRLYKKLIPLFMGIILGHFITAGLIYGLLSLSEAEIFRRYGVWFG